MSQLHEVQIVHSTDDIHSLEGAQIVSEEQAQQIIQQMELQVGSASGAENFRSQHFRSDSLLVQHFRSHVFGNIACARFTLKASCGLLSIRDSAEEHEVTHTHCRTNQGARKGTVSKQRLETNRETPLTCWDAWRNVGALCVRACVCVCSTQGHHREQLALQQQQQLEAEQQQQQQQQMLEEQEAQMMTEVQEVQEVRVCECRVCVCAGCLCVRAGGVCVCV